MTTELSCRSWLRCQRLYLVLSVALTFSLCAAEDTQPSRGLALFNDYIGPLFRQSCYECHSHQAEKVKGGLVLDSRNGWANGGEHGPAIVPGQPDKSLLLRAVTHTDPDLQMPPKRKLSDEDISKIRDWIALGAPDPRTENATNTAPRSARNHWAFQPVRRPGIPGAAGGRGKIARDAQLARNPVDAFISTTNTLAPEADRRKLIRRLSFDLLGLAPTPEEIAAFLADRDPRAYEKLVDRFLNSPQYGERWARHWLDVAGFAESSLFISDVVRPGFWRYRDYVIRAFNSDKPYNEFIMEQLAGDELFDWRATEAFTPEQIDLLAATGFLRCPPDATDNQPITQQEKIYPAQQQAMEVSMKALLGLTMNCVRCHSHKYDPIPHEDYYALIAIFQPAYDPEKWLPGIWSDYPGPIRAIPILPRAAREDYIRKSRAWPVEYRELHEQVNGGLLRRWRDPDLERRAKELTDESERERLLSLLRKVHADRTAEDEKFISSCAEKLGLNLGAIQTKYPEFSNALATAKARVEKIKADGKKLPPVIWATFDVSTNPSPAQLLRRGDYEQPAHAVQPAVLSALDNQHSFRISDPPYYGTTGRRLALARWITQRDHPLTARVMVNRIWQYHFGTGLVATPDDFGARGAPPTHPELLDWLAAEFMDQNWSIKHIHRLILNSAYYRQSSGPSRSSPSPLNGERAGVRGETVSHASSLSFPPRRLEAEVLRDTMLQISGQLDQRFYGESIPTLRFPDGRCGIATNSPDRNRRSIYISTRRTTVPTFLTVFDAPSMDTNWPKRNDSVIPQQALALMNSDFVLHCSEQFARRLLRETHSAFDRRLERAFLLAYGRLPGGDGRETFKKFSASTSNPNDADDMKIWTTICHALFSSNEFLYVD